MGVVVGEESVARAALVESTLRLLDLFLFAAEMHMTYLEAIVAVVLLVAAALGRLMLRALPALRAESSPSAGDAASRFLSNFTCCGI